MKFDFKPFTIITMIGPTRSGKSTLVEELQRQLELIGPCAVISSDQLRHTLLQDHFEEYDVHSSAMMEVSAQAFDLLGCLLRNHTSFPVNTPFVIVDTTGFDPRFRNMINNVARGSHYNSVAILLDYKDKSEYLKYVNEESVGIVTRAVARFRKEILPELRSREFDRIFRVNTHLTEATVEVDTTLLDSCVGTNTDNTPIVVYGDSHECVETLKQLVSTTTSMVKDGLHVHLGDYLDKGNNTKAMIEYMEHLYSQGHFILIGNHEYYLYNRLKENITPAEPEVEETYFTSLKVLLEDEGLRERFFTLFENSLPFMHIKSRNYRTIYLTHAPCQNKYLGKVDMESIRAMRNFKNFNREESDRENLKFVYEEAVSNQPLHVFGHIAHNCKRLAYRNKVFLDTGACYGNYLSALVIQGNNLQFVKADTIDPVEKVDLQKDLTENPGLVGKFNIRNFDLTKEDYRLLNRVLHSPVAFLSGTMAPAPSAKGQLEPLDAAFDYFEKRGITEVFLEPKYMGSRCQLYLNFGENKEDFAVSRSGYVINHVEGLDEAIKAEKARIESLLGPIEEPLIIDCELMPWATLGASLINNQFYSYRDLVGYELSKLAEDEDFKSLDIAVKFELDDRIKLLQEYSHTLDIHAAEGPIYFKPFNILTQDLTPQEAFEKLNPDTGLLVNLSSAADRLTAEEYFQTLTVGKGMEGVVVKPNVPFSQLPEGVPEYMKVRNESYLTLVYGYDYLRRYDLHVRSKNISFKAKISADESVLGRKLLTATTREEREEYIVKIISNLKKEKELDPRL